MKTEPPENVESTDCIICLEGITSDSIIFPCQHSLHRSCFNSYVQHKLQQGQTSILCPLCQKEIMHIHPISIISTQPHTTIPTIHRSRSQSLCLTVCNMVLTLGVSGLLYYTVVNITSKL